MFNVYKWFTKEVTDDGHLVDWFCNYCNFSDIKIDRIQHDGDCPIGEIMRLRAELTKAQGAADDPISPDAPQLGIGKEQK